MDAWGLLRIAPTDDISAIRSAYAKALKAIDMDRDPKAYIALRDARDDVIADIRRRAFDAANAPVEDVIEPVEAPLPPPPPALPLETGDEGEILAIQKADAGFQSHFSAIARLLDGDPNIPLGTFEATMARTELAALLRDDRMEQMSFRAQTEAQLAHLVATALPRAETLVEPLIAAFGWEAETRVDTPPAIAAIIAYLPMVGQRRSLNITTDRMPDFRAPEPVAPPPPPPAYHDAQGDLLSNDDNAAFYGAHYAELAKLIFPEKINDDAAPPLTPDQQAEARKHFAILLSDPRMELIGFHAGAESELAQLIAHGLPRSDCLVADAIAFFKWEETEGRIDQAGMIAYILDRARGLRFIEAVKHPRHEYHKAWNELQEPVARGKWWSWLKKPADPPTIRNLLIAIRTQQPMLERELDEGKVAMWEKRLNSGKYPNNWRIVALIALVVLGYATLMVVSGQFRPPEPVDNVAAPTLSIVPSIDGTPVLLSQTDTALVDDILVRVGGRDLTYDQALGSNRPLAAAIADRLASSRRLGQSHDELVAGLQDMLYARFRTALRQSEDYAAISGYRKSVLRTLNALKAKNPDDCVTVARSSGKDMNAALMTRGGPQIDIERQEMIARILLDDRTTPDSSAIAIDAPLYLPRALIEEVASRAGLPDATRVQSMLNGDSGSADEQCRAHIAEIETLLDLPPDQGLRMLRLL